MENEFFRFDPTWQLHSLMTAEQRSFNFDSPLNSIVSSNNSSIVSNESFGVQEFVNYNGGDPNFIEFCGDPGFAERAAAFSCFNGRKTGYHEIEMRSVSDHQMLNPHEEYCLGAQDSDQCRELAVQAISARNKSPVFEKIAAGESGLSSSSNEMNPRKRRVNPKRKANESAAYPSAKHIKVGKGDVDTNTNQKKTTSKDHEHENCLIKSEKEQTKISDDPPKDYIHVRARRGEATDSHSLAERARREKIGERMKLLQDLVPGCDKVTGKAVMLDEIINYVQSLQRQVEFLSMKLASVNFRPKDVRIESHVSKHKILRSNNMFYETDNVQESKQCQNQNMQLQLASLDGVLQCFPQFESLSEGDLHRLAQMGLARF